MDPNYSEIKTPGVNDQIVNEIVNEFDLKHENYLVAKPRIEEGDTDSRINYPLLSNTTKSKLFDSSLQDKDLIENNSF